MIGVNLAKLPRGGEERERFKLQLSEKVSVTVQEADSISQK